MTLDFPNQIAKMSTWFIQRYFEDLETACEKALQTGVCGVLVDWDTPTSYTILVTTSVPYGQIYERRH